MRSYDPALELSIICSTTSKNSFKWLATSEEVAAVASASAQSTAVDSSEAAEGFEAEEEDDTEEAHPYIR